MGRWRVDQLVLGVGLVLFLVDVPLLEDLYLLHLFFEEVLEASEAVGLCLVDADGVEGELGVVCDQVVGEEGEGGPAVVADQHRGAALNLNIRLFIHLLLTTHTIASTCLSVHPFTQKCFYCF